MNRFVFVTPKVEMHLEMSERISSLIVSLERYKLMRTSMRFEPGGREGTLTFEKMCILKGTRVKFLRRKGIIVF